MKIANGQTKEAANIFFNKMEPTVTNETNGVNFYNILKNPQEEFGVPMSNEISPVSMEATKHRPSHFSSVKNVLTSDEMKELSKLMNGPMKKMLRLPNNITWSSQSSLVFRALEDDFMRPATVTGSENWVRELKWPGMSSWAKTKRIPLLSDNNVTSGYYKKFKNFSFFWILKAGHMVPLDAPSTAYKMLCTYLSEKC
ncbi:Retinoid-inducible serine carboxypeptidase [Armadillidium vulgare]|nr:Retinoid-inducible serine carboxypeptidase [Armadillidium vulgare]